MTSGGLRVIEGAAIAPVAGPEIGSGHIVLEGDRIRLVGEGPAPEAAYLERIDGSGCLATPGLINTHHHLYQWATQGLHQDATLFEWLTGLYPIWAGMDAGIVHGAATASLAWLAKSGCTTTADHHYLFPVGRGDMVEAGVRAATRVGLRFHFSRGSMDCGASSGGLPPDDVTEGRDEIIAATEEVIDRYHDPAESSMLRVAVGPCSPFSASRELMAESAALARRHGVRLHTHAAETVDEELLCRRRYGRTPVEYLSELGWLADDVWLAHCVHLSDADLRRIACAGTAVAHCPTSNGRLGVGIARVSELTQLGCPVGIGVDGAASSELTPLVGELRAAMLLQRVVHGPGALTARQALEIGTLGGARCLGREAEIGTLEPGKLADIALWRLDGFRAAIEDPVYALVCGPPPPLALLLVGGSVVVANDELRTIGEDAAARAGRDAHRRLLEAVT
ncbi:MAG TPA: 8-oxoguanine deaminase [Streptosporangiaceae bacterium]|nr:8-oxoguanine deaminase [Streptosporangiaceae bacterium]